MHREPVAGIIVYRHAYTHICILIASIAFTFYLPLFVLVDARARERNHLLTFCVIFVVFYFHVRLNVNNLLLCNVFYVICDFCDIKLIFFNKSNEFDKCNTCVSDI